MHACICLLILLVTVYIDFMSGGGIKIASNDCVYGSDWKIVMEDIIKYKINKPIEPGLADRIICADRQENESIACH